MFDREKYRTGTAFSLVFAMLFSMFLPNLVGAEDTATLPIQLVDEQTIGEGTVLQTYNKKISGLNSRVFVTKVDLNNPYAQVKPLYGKNGTFSEKQTVTEMAKEKGAIAAINADFFNMSSKTPFGLVVDNGKIESSMARMPYWYSLGILEDRSAIIDRFTYQGEVIAPNGAKSPIQGVNKEEYKSAGYASHQDQVNIYTPSFGQMSLGLLKGYENYVEVVVENQTVKEIRIQQPTAATIPANGYVLWGHGVGAKFLQEQFKVGEPVQVTSTHLASSGVTGLNAAMAGYLLLVDNGKPLPLEVSSIKGALSRSAVGISQDGKTLYLAAVEGPPNGRGMHLKELAVVMKEIGSYRAFNLDGGGSTTMVARKLADTEISLLNKPAYGTQRKVPTAIGIFNTAPAGEFQDFRIQGPLQAIKGAEVEYQVKGWDEHFHPYTIIQNEVSWSANDTFTGNKLLAMTPGVQQIKADYRGVTHTQQLEVIGRNQVEKLYVEPAVLAVNKNQSTTFKVKVKTKTGQVIEVPARGLSVSIPVQLGKVDGLTLTAGSEDMKGEMAVEFDGLQINVPVSVGTIAQPFESMDSLSGLFHTGHPKELSNQGSFSLTTGSEPIYRTNKAAQLKYNFAGAPSDEVRIAYGVLGNQPIPLPGTPISVGMWVYGDQSKHWLRAELVDKNGKIHYMTLANEMDFSGWKYVIGTVPAEAVYPLKLKSIYVVSSPEGAAQRPESGTVYFDEITLYQPYDPAKVVKSSQVEAGSSYPLGTELSVQVDVPSYVEPIPTVPLYLPGKKPTSYGFKLSGELPAKSITLSATHWPDNKSIGLLFMNELDKSFQELNGNRLSAGSYSFATVDQPGTYIPYYSDFYNPFLDVKAGTWYEDAIVQLYSEGVINGMSKSSFAPEAVLTRAQFVTLLGNWLGWKPDESLTLDFNDEIPAYAVPAVKVALSKGIVQGFPGQLFKPDAPLTRAQMAVMLYRALQDRGDQLIPEQEKTFADRTSIPEWAAEAVQVMSGKGYIKGIGDSFKPDVKATRAQAAVLIYQIKQQQ